VPVIFGHELKGKTMWIILAVIAAGVGLVVYVRSRSAAAVDQGAASQAPGDLGSSGGGGGGIAVPAPTQGIADTYQGALQQQQLAANDWNLNHQQQLASQQQQQFDLEQQLAKAIEPSQAQLQTQINLTNAAHEKELGGASADFCPAGTSTRLNPNTGQYVCRNKSGGFAFIGQFSDAISGFLGGVQSAAPGLGQQAATQIGGAYIGYEAGRAGAGFHGADDSGGSGGPSGDQSSLIRSPGGYNQPGYQQVGGGYGVALPVSMMSQGHNG
jgi:hypothetical protein